MDSSGSAIKIENVWKVFGNTSKEALDAIQNQKISKTEALEKYNSVIGVSDVSFDVKKGEIFCVMGLSGSGKSTLVRHINRLLEPTSGKILINGRDVMQFDRESLQELRNKKIGMVFQNFALMPHRSVLDNIAMPLEIRGVSKNDRLDAANKILDIVELQGWGNKFAHEYYGEEGGKYKAYLNDYERTFSQYPEVYGVPDTWDKFDAISVVIDDRYRAWKKRRRSLFRWPFL